MSIGWYIWLAVGFMLLSLALGIKWGREIEQNSLTEEIKEEFREKFLQQFIDAYNKNVEEKALEIAMLILDEQKKKERNEEQK